MRALPKLCLILLASALPLTAQASMTHAVVDIQASYTESPRVPGAGDWNKTRTFIVHVPCTLSEGPAAAMARMPAAAASMVPGVIAMYAFTPDKSQEGAHSGSFKYVEMSGSALTDTKQGSLTGPYSGSFGLASGVHQDDLVSALSSVLTGFYKGTETRDGKSEELRGPEAVLVMPDDPMDPDIPRPRFSIKAFQDNLAAGKPFTVSASKSYEFNLKDSHYKGSYTLTIAVAP